MATWTQLVQATCDICGQVFRDTRHDKVKAAVGACEAQGSPSQYFAIGTVLILHTQDGRRLIPHKITGIKIVNKNHKPNTNGQHVLKYFVQNTETLVTTTYTQERLMQQYGKGVFTKS